MSAVVTSATITCPECGTQTRAEMPTDACQFFWTCPACSARLRPWGAKIRVLPSNR